MTLQSAVNIDIGAGVVGEMAFDGPVRAQTGIIDSVNTTPAFNRVGRAFTHVAGADGRMTVGGSGVFAGILANPKVYPGYGDSTGPLAPTIDLPQYAQAEFVTMGEYYIALGAAAAIGDLIDYVTATGVLVTRKPGISFTASITSNVMTVSAIDANSAPLAVGQVFIGPKGEFEIISLGTGTGGTGTYNVSVIADSTSAVITGNSTPASGNTAIPRCVVSRYNVPSAGLAVAKITN